MCQPSTPFIGLPGRAADLNLSPADTEVVRRRAAQGCSVLGIRYASDPLVGTRFDTLTALIGDAFIRVDLEGEGHSTVTEHRSQRPSTPSSRSSRSGCAPEPSRCERSEPRNHAIRRWLRRDEVPSRNPYATAG